MNSEIKMIIGVVVASVVILVLGMFLAMRPEKVYEKSQLIPIDAVTSGNKNAALYLVEFSDFQCPACGAFASEVEALLEQYGDKLLFVYRHFPLPQHPEAVYAAYAFEAAHKQGKSWAMAEYLFANQKKLAKEYVDNGAQSLGLDMTLYQRDVTSKAVEDVVTRDLHEAKAFGINSTPTFFLNGKKLHLTSVKDLKRAVDEAMHKSEQDEGR